MAYPDITIIVGSGRSGTTYLARMLLESLDIGFAAEPKFVVPMYRRLRQYGDLTKPENLRRLVETIHKGKLFTHLDKRKGAPSTVDELWDRVQEPTYTGVLYAVFQLVADKRGKSRLGYKDPADLGHMPLLEKLFPTARFVHIIRDGRDVAQSMLKFKWGATNLYAGSRYWAGCVARGRADGARLQGRYLELHLEDLILETEKVATELGQFITRGTQPEQVADLVERVNRTKRPETIFAWRRTFGPDERKVCEAAAGDVLRKSGYPVGEPARLSPIRSSYFMGVDLLRRAPRRLFRVSRR